MDESETDENTPHEPSEAGDLVSEPGARTTAADGFAAWLLSETGPSYWLLRTICVLVFGFIFALAAMLQTLVGPMLAQQYHIDRAAALQQLTSMQSQIPHWFGGSAAVAVVCIISMIQSKRMSWIQMAVMIAACAGLMYSLIYHENAEYISNNIRIQLNLQPNSPAGSSSPVTNRQK